MWYDVSMRMFVTLTFIVAACSGPQSKPESTIVDEGTIVADTCCCKLTPLASSDGRPVYEDGKRMECSVKQGTCLAAAQCERAPEPAATTAGLTR